MCVKLDNDNGKIHASKITNSQRRRRTGKKKCTKATKKARKECSEDTQDKNFTWYKNNLKLKHTTLALCM